ncbi:RNA polymerase sigma factor [Maribellus sediminis]|uniref:RNA polymerase sigma factor n=1 Tax=Maribellus sediminis TaxID=2696285 RepID=UPI001F112211|nr:sigma-70 family RNA polymerase sigma factor [Maribellus sediminis]
MLFTKSVIIDTLAAHLQLILEDLKQIIKECAKGNTRAQEQLYKLFAPKMYGVCLRYSKDKTEAEDNLQEGFIKVFTGIKNFRHEGSFEGWMRRIMVNVSLEKFRKQQLMYPVEDMAMYEGNQVSDDILANISAQEITGLIQELTPRYRMVFNLYVFEGMSHEEISKEMNISTGTSKSNLARARDVLKNRVRALYGGLDKNNTA